jgi:hypothetical protein
LTDHVDDPLAQLIGIFLQNVSLYCAVVTLCLLDFVLSHAGFQLVS